MKKRKVEEFRASNIGDGQEKKREKSRLGSVFAGAVQMFRGRGITRRWLMNFFVLIALFAVGICVAVFFFGRSYYYSSIEQGLTQRSAVTIRYFSSTLDSGVNSGNSEEFYNAAQAFVESFDDRDKMELQLLDATGSVIVSSTGFNIGDDQPLRDYNNAVQSSNGVGAWSGMNSNGENVMAVTRLISSDGAGGGAVRYVVSLSGVNQMMLYISLIMAFACVALMAFVLLSGNYFVNSIVLPVREITVSANKIAKGDFDIRLHSRHDDEIGSLVGAINSMASELAANEQLKNDFISTVSHELRTPLTAIKGWGETLRDYGPEDRELMGKGMDVIIRESDRLSGLVEDLLDFSRLQNGRFKIEYCEFDIAAELADAVYMCKKQCAAEGKTLSFSAAEGLPAVVGDRDRIRQVFVNIIDNAIKYSDFGGKIDASIARDGDFVVICVRDSGCGIAEKDLALVSKRFYKANTGRSGFGIGLAVVDEIVSLHHGHFGIESTEGVGTTVTVRLPIDASAAGENIPNA